MSIAPTSAPITLADAAQLLSLEALYLDEQRWDDWLDLYTDDAVLWMPTWRGLHELTTSPDSELSFIYCDSRQALSDRVYRIQSGLSVASSPLPRTVHAISNILIEDVNAVETDVSSVGAVFVFDVARGKRDTFFCRYRYVLRTIDGRLRIARKKIVIADDRIETMLDFYCV